MLHKRPDWYLRAACRGLSPDLFYGEREAGNESNIHNAIEVCRSCPVIMECLQYAISEGEIYGVWGGVSPKKRRPSQIKKTIASVQAIIESRETIVMTPAARRKKLSRQRSKLATKASITP